MKDINKKRTTEKAPKPPKGGLRDNGLFSLSPFRGLGGCIIFFLLFLFLGNFSSTLIKQAIASKIDELKTQITDKNSQIDALQKEIDDYQKVIDQSLEQSASLKNEISRIENTRKQLNSSILLTQRKIEAANLIIESLNNQISAKENDIADGKTMLAEIVRKLNEGDKQTAIEITLSDKDFSDFFDNLEQVESLQNSLYANLNKIKDIKASLQDEEEAKQAEKEKLETLNSQLLDQKALAEMNKAQKNKILTATKNKESAYKKLVAERLAQQKEVEAELKQIESQLKMEIDPASLPTTGSGVLGWPLKQLFVTQPFGNTPFATKNPQLYNGSGHDGLDLKASIGTPVMSAEDGFIADLVDSNISCNGKWILVQHPNNVSTLYAHLSLIKVYKGQQVKRGQLIAYSGDTGYATGPHLHFGVMVTKAIQIKTIKPRSCRTTITYPLAPANGYLNPLSYL